MSPTTDDITQMLFLRVNLHQCHVTPRRGKKRTSQRGPIFKRNVAQTNNTPRNLEHHILVLHGGHDIHVPPYVPQKYQGICPVHGKAKILINSIFIIHLIQNDSFWSRSLDQHANFLDFLKILFLFYF